MKLGGYNRFRQGKVGGGGGALIEAEPSSSETNWCEVAGPHGRDPPLEAFQTRDRRPGGPNYSNRVNYKSGTTTISTHVIVLGIHNHSGQGKQIYTTAMLPPSSGINA